VYISARSEIDFANDLTNHQISSEEFFDQELLRIIKNDLNINNALIVGYDNDATFSSWIDLSTTLSFNSKNHPYHYFSKRDRCAKYINTDCTKANLSANMPTSKLYQSTKIISPNEYGRSDYTTWLKNNLNSYYSIALPFGMNGCFHLCFYKTEGQSDFTGKELDAIQSIYKTIFCSYKAFHKEQELKVVSNIKNEIISLGEKAYIITNSELKVLAYSNLACDYLCSVLGYNGRDSNKQEFLFGCLSLIIDISNGVDVVRVRNIKDYLFSVGKYIQSNSNNFPQTYYYITITKCVPETACSRVSNDNYIHINNKAQLTRREVAVAKMLCEGKSYQEIADTFFISYHTVKNHVQNIFQKCGINSRFQLLTYFGNQQD